MPSVVIGKRLLAELQLTREFVASNGGDTAALDAVISKVEQKQEAAETKAAVPMQISPTIGEEMLVEKLGPRAVTKLGTPSYVRCVRLIKQNNVTQQNLEDMLNWIGRQKWLAGKKSLLDILMLMPRYLPTATQERLETTKTTGVLLGDDD